ncbi:MAG TPA: hypothetical protein VHV28_14265, partial [Solirubrobacteraceae bacterium]|nr:hypothetical protein [Solirubrobacteraceae bacterium]
ISPVVNNGVIVTLGGRSAWTVTGTSYLSKLTIAKTATVSAPRGRHLAMTVNGVSTPITPGSTYSGNVALSVS